MNIIKKRINSLTTYLILLSVVALVYWLHKLDSKVKFRDLQSLTDLELFLKKPPPIYPFQLEQYAKQIKPVSTKEAMNMSREIYKIITTDIGIEYDTGKRLPYARHYPGLFYLDADSIRELSINPIKSTEEKQNQIEELSVSEAIFNYLRYFKPSKIFISTSYDTAELAKFLTGIYHIDKYGSLEHLTNPLSLNDLKKNKYFAGSSFLYSGCGVLPVPDPSSEMYKMFPDDLKYGPRFVLSISINMSRRKSWFRDMYTKLDSFETNPAQIIDATSRSRIAKFDSAILSNIRHSYGTLPLADAKSLLEQEYLLAYQTISVFGFDVSTKHFPFIVLLLTTLFIVSIFFAVRQSKSKKYRLFQTNVDDSNLFEFYVNNPYLRFACWVVLPVGLAVLSLPLYSLDLFVTLSIFAWAVVNAAVGFVCFKYSIKPD